MAYQAQANDAAPAPGGRPVPPWLKNVLLCVVLLVLASDFGRGWEQAAIPHYPTDPDVVQIWGGASEVTRFADTVRWWTGPWIEQHSLHYRPIVSYLMWAEYRLAGPHETLWLRVNLILYLLFVLEIYWLGAFLFRSRWAGFIAGLIFAVPFNDFGWAFRGRILGFFPGQTDQLCGFFYLLALIALVAALRRRSGALYLASLGTFALAIGSKEMAYSFPFVATALIWHEGRTGWRWAGLAAPFWLTAVALFALRTSIVGLHIIPGRTATAESLADKPLQLLRYLAAPVSYGATRETWWVLVAGFLIGTTAWAIAARPRVRRYTHFALLGCGLAIAGVAQLFGGDWWRAFMLVDPQSLGIATQTAVAILVVTFLYARHRRAAVLGYATVFFLYLPMWIRPAQDYYYLPFAGWALLDGLWLGALFVVWRRMVGRWVWVAYAALPAGAAALALFRAQLVTARMDDVVWIALIPLAALALWQEREETCLPAPKTNTA